MPFIAPAVVGDEPFAVILPDDLIEDGNRGCMAQMVRLYEEKQTSILGVERVHPSETGSYGIVKTGEFQDHQGRSSLLLKNQSLK